MIGGYYNNNQKILKYFKTKKGLPSNMLRIQRRRSKQRGYLPPNYTLKELSEWLTKQSNWDKLYYNWVESGYKQDLKPSIDRLDDYKGYSLDNIKLVTYRENVNRSYHDRKNGVNKKNMIGVSKFDLQGNFIQTYYSIAQAARENVFISEQNIRKAIYSKKHISKGFIWKRN